MNHSIRNIAGLEISAIDEPTVVQHLATAANGQRGGWIVTANADIARQCRKDSELATTVAKADLMVADGMPLVWASRICGRPVPERVCGSDLVWSIAERASQDGLSLFLLGGGHRETAPRAACILQERYPNLIISGTHYPPFGFESDAAEMAKLREALTQAKPDIVYVALGFPKAERLINLLRMDFPKTWWIGVGISLSFIAGEVARAPQWVQRLGLEWLHRMVQEPGRLVKRYLWHDVPFVLWLTAWAIRARLRGSE